MDTKPLGASEDEIRSILRLRRARKEAFGERLLGDISWDILLQLYGAHLGGRQLMLSELDMEAPTSTVARWAALLETQGFIALEMTRSKDLSLRLSEEGLARMDALFREYRSQQAMI